VEARILERQPAGGGEARLAAIAARREAAVAERAVFAERWEKEKALIETLDKAVADGKQAAEVRVLRDELIALQAENPLIGWCVDAAVVGQVVSEWTGIPVGAMSQDAANV